MDEPQALMPPENSPPDPALSEIANAFLKLGCTSFGGPVAHLGYFREEFVVRRKWLLDDSYADLVALCQFLPGPASSQVVFALGSHRAGWVGGLLASLCFTAPSALLMILFAYAAQNVNIGGAGWIHGLKLAAVAVVAQAILGMGKSLCPDIQRLAIASLVAAVVLLVPNPWLQIIAILFGAVAGYFLYRRASGRTPTVGDRRARAAASAILSLFLLLLLALPLLASWSGRREIAAFDSFYRAGSLVFGGGHVVLPLLRAEVVPRGWVSDDTFLAGYGAAQALPGPLFTFSAYLGAMMNLWGRPWLGGLWCLVAIFLPAWLLIAGALPFWTVLRTRLWAQSALRGANAAVVGVLVGAFWNPVCQQGLRNSADLLVALAGLAMLRWGKAPSWLVVLFAAAAGQWGF